MGLWSKRSLGIRIRGGQAAFVLLGRVFGRVRLLASGTLPLPQGIDDRTSNTGLPLRRRPDEVIVGLPRCSIVLRSLELPALDEQDLAGLLAYEIERHLPFPPEEACYSFQRLKQEGGRMKVLLAAARKAEVEHLIGQVEPLGLSPTAVDVSAFAAANALLHQERPRKGEVLALIDLHGSEAEVSMVRDRVLLYSRAIPLEENSFEPLLLELRRAFEKGEAAPTAIYISGGGEEVRRRLEEEVEIPVLDVRCSMLDARTLQLNPTSDLDPSAFGLALKGLVKLPLQLDLLPQERRRKRRERAVVVMFALLALLGVLGGALGLSSAYRELKAFRQLTQRIAEVKTQAAEVEALQAEFTTLKSQLQLLEGIAREQGRPLLVLKELVGLLPADVALNEFSLEGNKVQIRGTTGASASDLISAFERSSLFENAAFTSPISTQGKDRQGFQLQAFIKGR
ncbi:MAG: pilus assembly protein PilM [Candidatus Methylomirabilales bacterium]